MYMLTGSRLLPWEAPVVIAERFYILTGCT